MVHSVLMLACTALSLCLLVHLLSFHQELGGDFRLKLSLRWTYICLGISIALGILSKYNFLFFVLILFFLSLISKNLRKVLWGRYTPLCIVVTLFCLSPHLYWLSQNHYAPILHALSRAESGQADLAYSWKYFFDIYVFFFLFAFVFLCFLEN